LTRRQWMQLSVAGTAATTSLIAQTTRATGGDERIPQAPPLSIDNVFRRVTLEVSLKPFHDLSPAAIRQTCEEMFRSWAALLRRCASSAIMLWSADGSEILEYRGNMDDAFDWARYLGDANPPTPPPANDPGRQGTHGRHWLYMEHPPRMTYATLRLIVRTLRETGERMTGKPVEVGATFDPGGEFAVSDFKFHRHLEIAKGGVRGPNTWVEATGRLNADSKAYAGYPGGIPAGTSIGAFLGKQSRHFLADMGFDYLWLSNGFGFSLGSWDVSGPLFQGKTFDARKARALHDEILSFWQDFRAGCPTFRIETRGSNLIVGADLSAHGSPVREIYRGGFNMVAPPNSPWAALDGDFGLELVGYLSRIAELPPGDVFPFRFYTHDPWWLNSPWLDRYGRDPQDIYLPLALARIDGKAAITRPSYLEFLTIDNSWGQMPEKVPNEVIPHILFAMEDYSDAPGLVTWVYPFDEYHDMTFGAQPRLADVFFGDWFMRGAVNNGFPLNSVVSTRQLVPAYQANPKFFEQTILLAYAPALTEPVEKTLTSILKNGGNVLLYGPLENSGAHGLVGALGLSHAEPISGDMDLRLTMPKDSARHGELPLRVRHRPEVSAGGIGTILPASSANRVKACASVVQAGNERAYAVSRTEALGSGSGTLAWARGTFSSAVTGSRLPEPDDPKEWFAGEALMRLMLSQFGYTILNTKQSVNTRNPLMLFARQRNGWFLSSYSPSTTGEVKLRFAHGAPVLIGMETWVEDGHSSYTLPRATHKEFRCLVDQVEGSEVSCVEAISEYPFVFRRLLVKGLKNATVHFYPENDRKVIMRVNESRSFVTESLPYERAEGGSRLVIKGVTGELNIAW
jgi:hypothetical protein